MARIGWHASHEQIAPSRLLEYARQAEQAGFEAGMSSDHFSPWSERQGESGFAWSWLGAALASTSLPFRIVNAPGQRYHPAIVAQAAATLEEMSRHAGSLLRRGARHGGEPRHRRSPGGALAYAVVDRRDRRLLHGGGSGIAVPPADGAEGFGADEVNVETQYRDMGSLPNWFERLLRRRKDCPQLGWGTLRPLDTGEAAVFAHRSDWQGGTVVAVHNLAERSARSASRSTTRRSSRR